VKYVDCSYRSMNTMDMISAPSDEFAKHDLLIMSARSENLQRLAGELRVRVYVTSALCVYVITAVLVSNS